MPKQVSVRPADWAASRKASATRLTTWRVRESSTLPPLILLPRQRPNQEQKALALRHLLISTPISETISSTLSTLSPTTFVRSTPQMRSNKPASSILGSLALGLRFLLVFSGLAFASLDDSGSVTPCCASAGLLRARWQELKMFVRYLR